MKDKNFKGSIFKKMGLSDELCSKCKAHLTKSGICLNGCHLSPILLERFQTVMEKLAEQRGSRGESPTEAEKK